MNSKINYFRFEYVDDFGYSTIVEKQIGDDDTLITLTRLMSEIRLCLLACGFTESLVNDYIDPDIF